MLKVLIADDEKKVCRLIQMLCDWKKLDMELVGTAYNGIQAMEMVEQYRPDILITDICMPGCDGIEVIKHARDKGIFLEVLIISGYTDFKYAQSAIRYGVVDYLLKPIKQQELEETLLKLGARCRQERARLDASHQLLQYMESDQLRRRCGIFFDLLLPASTREIPELEVLNERYCYHFIPGLFRILVLKLDSTTGRNVGQAIQTVSAGMEEKLRAFLEECCQEMEICQDGDTSFIICNYSKESSHQFRQAVRNAVDQILMKRFQLGEIVFSLGMGKAVSDCSQLGVSLDGALAAVRERLLEGCDRLLEPPDVPYQKDYSELIAGFNHNCAKALELMDEKMALSCVDQLKESLLAEKSITGSDLLKVVSSVGIHAMTNGLKNDHRGEISGFHKECEECYQVDQLFRLLGERLCGMIESSRQEHQEEERRPVRLAKQYLMNHYTEAITLELVAAQVGFSSSYFSSVFKKEAGIGFADYLTQLRMEKAKDLLKNSKTNIKDICVEVGYSDLKHFTATFRKYTGLKPGEFRKLYG